MAGFSAVEAEDELVEIGLQIGFAQAVIDAELPGLESSMAASRMRPGRSRDSVANVGIRTLAARRICGIVMSFEKRRIDRIDRHRRTTKIQAEPLPITAVLNSVSFHDINKFERSAAPHV